MNPILAQGDLCRRFAAAVLVALLALGTTGVAVAGELEELLEEVGEEYAKAYTSPFLYAFGPTINSGMYSTAAIPLSGLTFGVTLRASAAQIDEEDQNFTRVLTGVNLGDFDPAFEGVEGTIVLSGPTVFGSDETMGTVTGYVNGLPVIQEEGIEGLVDTKFVPMFTPEFCLGGVAGLKLVIRWLPEIEIGDYGKFKYLGYGLQWNTAQVLKNLPVDLMVGFGKQKLEIDPVLEVNASSYFAAASKDFSPLTVYGGLAIEDSDMTIAYIFADQEQDIEFTVDGVQDSRMTLGATLNLGLKINAEVAKGKMTTFSGALILGF